MASAPVLELSRDEIVAILEEGARRRLDTSLEAVIRVLVEEFNVPTRVGPDVWRPVLAESERLFAEIAHRPLSGPAS